jgi:hypothetical protein
MEPLVNPIALILGLGIALSASAATAASLSVDLRASDGNPTPPRIGDTLSFHTVIRNDGAGPVRGLIAWIGLIRTDEGNEQPVDLEDWSAQKAVTLASLAPGRAVESDWPVRLIQTGSYRLVVSAVGRDGSKLATSRFADFSVRGKPTVESRRVLPVALGLPLLIGAAMAWRHGRSARGALRVDPGDSGRLPDST